jgi:hypothetical protein
MAVLILVLFWLALAAFAAVGWVMNIITLLHTQYLTIATIVRFIGIFMAPLGAVLGYF